MELDTLLSYALVINPGGWLSTGDIRQYCPQAFKAPTGVYNRIRNAICQSDSQGLKRGAEDFLKYMREGSFETEETRGAFVKSYYLIGDTLQDIDRALYTHLRSGNLLRNIENALTWYELEHALQRCNPGCNRCQDKTGGYQQLCNQEGNQLYQRTLSGRGLLWMKYLRCWK